MTAMRKLWSAVLAAVLVFLLAACGAGKNSVAAAPLPESTAVAEQLAERQEAPEEAEKPDSSLRAIWAEEAELPAEYTELVADMPEPRARLLLLPEEELKDFRLVHLRLTDADENGDLVFEEEEICLLDSLTPACPLIAEITFYGDLPCYMVGWSNGNGGEKRFLLEISGEDGSLLLTEY